MREAIGLANSTIEADRVLFANNLIGQTLRLDAVNGPLVLSSTISINGGVGADGSSVDITISGDVLGDDILMSVGQVDVTDA
ncbi:MAG: hypothetical protein AAGH42_01815 [Pseudomonadota bacterium]